MNLWIAASVVLGVTLVPCLGVCVLCAELEALTAVELASALTTCLLMLLSEGLHRQPFIDLALTFALVSVIGSLAFARMLEHEL